MTIAYDPSMQAYDPFETDMLTRFALVSIRHPEDPDVLTAGELRDYRLHSCFTGPSRESVDMMLDDLANRLEEGE